MSSATTQPPTITTHVGTPSTEWARETVGAVDNAADATTGKASPNEGRIPGEFPGSVSHEDDAELANTAKASLQQAQQTAREVAASAGSAAQSMFATAGETARQYLPAGVVQRLEDVGVIGRQASVDENTHVSNAPEHDLRPADSNSLPSNETGPFHPTHGGVGTLPGTSNEEGVAKLPDERIEDLRSELPTREQEPFMPSHAGVGSLPGGKDEVAVAELPHEKTLKETENDNQKLRTANDITQLKDELPTREKEILLSTAGVGTLPSEKDETSVAVLREEKNLDAHKSGTAPTPVTTTPPNIPSADVPFASAPFSHTHSTTIPPAPTSFNPDTVPGTHQPTSNAERVPPAPMPVPKDRSYGIGAQGPAAIAQGDGHGAPPVPEKESVMSGSTSSTDSTKKSGKVGFGTKLKAEAKIISGKLRSDEAKVSEGKAMKSGEI